MPFIPSAAQINQIATPVSVANGGTGASTAVAARLNLVANPSYPLAYKSTYFYAAKHATAGNGNQALIQDRMYLLPFQPSVTNTFDRICIYQASNAVAGAVGRMGLYSSDATGLPSTLVVDAGTFAADSGGAGARRDITISQSLTGGRFTGWRSRCRSLAAARSTEAPTTVLRPVSSVQSIST